MRGSQSLQTREPDLGGRVRERPAWEMLDHSFDASPAGHTGKGGGQQEQTEELVEDMAHSGHSGSTCQGTDKGRVWGGAEDNPGRCHEASSVTFWI